MCAVPVLMYHALEDADHPSGALDAGEQLYVLRVDQFSEQMAYLHREGYRTLLLEELQALPVWPEKSVVLTFDDGHQSNYTLALPILQKYAYKAHFFITTGWTGTPYYMTRDEIQGLHRAGMGVGGHGVTHRFLTDLTQSEMLGELTASKEALEACLGVPVTTMSYPGGRMSHMTNIMALKHGYRHLFSSVPTYIEQGADRTVISRLAVTAGMTLDRFESLLQGRGLNAMMLRHSLLAATKSILGNDLYQRIRSALVRSA